MSFLDSPLEAGGCLVLYLPVAVVAAILIGVLFPGLGLWACCIGWVGPALLVGLAVGISDLLGP